MAFKPPMNQERAPKPLSEKEVGSVLRPDPDAASKLSDSQRQRAGDDARVSALRTMNAVRMLSPVLAKVAAEGGSDEEQASRFSALMEKTNAMAIDAAIVLGVSPDESKHKWVLNVFERAFSEVLSKNLDEPAGRETVRALVRAAKDRGNDAPHYQNIDEEVSLTAARVQALGPVLRAQVSFDFARPREQTIEEVMKCLDEEVVSAVDMLAEPLAEAPERRTLFSVVSQEAGELMAEAWNHEAGRAIAALRKKTIAEREAWKTANPQGLPIETVLTRFRQHMGRLVKLTKQLRPSTKKPIRK